jgi:succinyl-CoA:acetate CoA-transferase
VVAVVETHHPDRNSAFTPPDDASRQIAGHIIEFLQSEVKRGRLPANLLPLQSGVGNIANAVMAGLLDSPSNTSPPTPRCCRTACWSC